MKTMRKNFLKMTALVVLALIGCQEVGGYLTLEDKVEQARKKIEYLDIASAKLDDFDIYEVGEEEQELRQNGEIIDITVWYPMDKNTPSPLIYFLQGLLGSKESHESIARGLARRGNIVITRNYLDSLELEDIGLLSDRFSVGRAGKTISGLTQVLQNIRIIDDYTTSSEIFQRILENPELYVSDDWHENELGEIFCEMFDYRIGETEDLISAVEDGRLKLPAKADYGNQLLFGHSLGGWTALKMAIKHPEKFKGIGCLSPAVEYSVRDGIQEVTVPALYITGDIDTFKCDVEGIFDMANSPKVFVSFRQWGHSSPSNTAVAYGVGIPSLMNGTLVALINGKSFLQLVEILIPLTGLSADYPAQAENFQVNAIVTNNLLGHFAEACTVNDDGCWESLEDMGSNERMENCVVRR